MMIDREKVIKGLEVILEETADMFYRSTIQDALALLKEQESLLKSQKPKVMTLEEIRQYMNDLPC